MQGPFGTLSPPWLPFPIKFLDSPTEASRCSHHLVIPEFVSPQLTSDLEDYSLLSFCSSWHSKPCNINGSLASGEMKAWGRERTILKAYGETRWCSQKQKAGVWALGLLPPHHHTSSASMVMATQNQTQPKPFQTELMVKPVNSVCLVGRLAK